MAVQKLIAVALVALVGNGISARVNGADPKAGDLVVIRMTGDLAKEYASRTHGASFEESPPGLEIQVVALLARQLDDERVQIEHASRLVRNGGTVRHVTVTATVARQQIVECVRAKGTVVRASPKAGSTARTEESAREYHLRLSDLEGVKLRTWTLAEEIGG